jgi:hypothetical protein
MTLTAVEPRVVDEEQVGALIELAVDLMGDTFRYEEHFSLWSSAYSLSSCVYRSRHGTPCCLIGKVFSLLGILNQAVPNDRYNTLSVRELIKGLTFTDRTGVRFTRKAAELLGNAQSLQDGGSKWGEVLDFVYDHFHRWDPIHGQHRRFNARR